MATAGSVAAVTLAASGLISTASAAEVWRRRGAVGRTSLTVILGAAAVWSLAYAMEASAGTAAGREAWGSVKYLGINALPAAWLIFTLEYSGRVRRVSPRLVLALAVGPVLVMAMLAVPATRHLIRSYPAGMTEALPPIRLGPLFWPWFAYWVALVGLGTGPLVVSLLRTSHLYRRQVRLILAALTLVLVANLTTNLGVGIFERFDPTPVALSLAGLLLMWGMVRFRLLELLPVARTALVERMADAVLVTDPQHRVVDLNPAAQRIVGPASSVVGRRVDELLGTEAPDPNGPPLSRRELALPTGGEDRHFELMLSHLDDGRSGHVGYLLVLRDITERKRAELRLEELAHHDPLTGLPNRLLFADRMAQALLRAQRSGAPLAVLFLDLDDFKVINDGLGHDVGDQVLVHVASRLESCLRRQDTLARLGGDEFIAILPEITEAEDTVLVATKMLDELARPLIVDDHVLHVTASVGIAVCPQDGDQQRVLLSQADAAMYVAKVRAPGSIEFASPIIKAHAEDRHRLEGELRQALGRGELFLEYQPLIDLGAGDVFGFEVLVRWRHPVRGVLPPDEFIHWAEEARLIADIDKWVLEEACRRASSWQADGRSLVSVNLSPVTLGDTRLATTVTDALASAGLDPRCLCLELNERTLIDDTEVIAAMLDRLKGMGVSIAVDDFGVGHTSLAQIRRLPLDFLKIDRSLVGGLGGQPDETPIVSAIIDVAHVMGLRVLAEGVERIGELSALRAVGCDMGQGFFFSAPVSLDAAGKMMADHRRLPARQVPVRSR